MTSSPDHWNSSFYIHRDTDSNVKIDITNALYLLSNYVKNQNYAKGYSKTQDLLEFKMLKKAEILNTHQNFLSHNCSRNGQKIVTVPKPSASE